MWLSKSHYEQLVQQAAQAELVSAATARAEVAERALADERRQATTDLRHLISMWLRREKTYPLPATQEEKAEKVAEREQRQTQPPRLNADQQARLDASVAWGLQNGFTKEQAEKAFMSQLTSQMDE